MILLCLCLVGCTNQTKGIKLTEVEMYSDKIIASVPKELEMMSEGRIVELYRNESERPQYVYTNPEVTVIVSFAKTKIESNIEMMGLMQEFLVNRWTNLEVTEEVTTEGIIDINGKDFGVIRYVNVTDDPYKVLVIHSLFEGYMLKISFKYPESEEDKWFVVEEQFINSLQVNDNE